MTDHFVSNTNATACSPFKDRDINVTSSLIVSPLKEEEEDHSSCRSDGSSNDTIDKHRENGQQKLRELVITGASTGTIDWKSIISLAEELHRKEQKLLNSYKTHPSSRRAASICNNGKEYTSISRPNISRKQAFFELRSKRRENARRRKLERVGSFSVNLLLYGADECTNYCGEKSTHHVRESTVSDHEDDGNEVDVYEDIEEDFSLSSQSNQVQFDEPTLEPNRPSHNNHASSASLNNVVEGSFFAATSMYNTSSHIDETEDSSEVSNSESSSSSTISFPDIEKTSWDQDDGLITIHEDASVNLW